jgi:hypothetical protein
MKICPLIDSLERLNPTHGESAELFWTKKSMLASFNIRSPDRSHG